MTGNVLTEPSQRFPKGYEVKISRYADSILKTEFESQFTHITNVLEHYKIEVGELVSGGGSRASHTKRFDDSLAAYGWGKRNITISTSLDREVTSEIRTHEIDMFCPSDSKTGYPGVAVEVEWNNKDPFFDRDLLNFQALHAGGALAAGVIVTRGPKLQGLIETTIKTAKAATFKYGKSTTHWDKLVPRVQLGGGGQCPLILIGIEPERVVGAEKLRRLQESGKFTYPGA